MHNQWHHYISEAISQNCPFVAYTKPDQQIVTLILQKDSHVHLLSDYNAVGFVIAPFDTEKPSYLLPYNSCAIHEFDLIFDKTDTDQKKVTTLVNPEAKQNFEALVSRCISQIDNGEITKIVASRKEELRIQDYDLAEILNRVFTQFPTAFRYCFYLPEIGLWVGATPEKLVSIESGKLQTMAYAGTQLFQGDLNPKWGDKEKEEQALVTRFITEQLQNQTLTISKSDPYTSKAGTLLHIRTDISAELKEDYKLEEIINTLHPTPAVCGTPKALAKAFILANEGYNRKFYSGFLGELNMGAGRQTDLYVNLRCMELEADQISFYVGCGITKDSQPELEFFETVNKSQTMKSVVL